MNTGNLKKQKRQRRHVKIRSKVFGTQDVPRLAVFKSNKHIMVQVINDDSGKTLTAVHSREVKGKNMTEKSIAVGVLVAEKAKKMNVSKIVFDRGGFIYTGNIKALADAARSGGLQF
ncbi:MAG: 50S ribosomal protein L18 [Patescibacteria group bacterium]